MGLEGAWLVLGTTVLGSLAPGDAQSLSLTAMQLRALDSILGFRAWRFVWPEGSSCCAARRSGHNTRRQCLGLDADHVDVASGSKLE